MLTEVEGTQQDIEAQQIGKYEPYVLGQPEVIGIDSFRQQIRRTIRWCHLISRHTISKGQDGKQQHCQNIRQALL